MPFRAEGRHKYWSADVRYSDVVDEQRVGARAYAIIVLDNYSRAVLPSKVSPTQDLSAAFLSFLYRAVERHGFEAGGLRRPEEVPARIAAAGMFLTTRPGVVLPNFSMVLSANVA